MARIKFKVRKYELERENLSKRKKGIMDRAIDVVSNRGEDYVVGVNDAETTNATMAYLIKNTDFPQRFNESPYVLKMAYLMYQGYGYQNINKFLRKNKGLKRETEEIFESRGYKNSIEDEIDALDMLIESQPGIQEDVILYRGTDLKELSDLKIEEIDNADELIGKTYTNYGYTSTTYTSTFRGWSFSGSSVIIAIRVPKGTPVLGPIGSLNEEEILLGRGYSFKIVNMEQINNKYVVYVDLLPRELEKTTKTIEDIKQPQFFKDENEDEIKEEELYLKEYGEIQQDIIVSEEKRKLKYEITKILREYLHIIQDKSYELDEIYNDLNLINNRIDVTIAIDSIAELIEVIQEGEFGLNDLYGLIEQMSMKKNVIHSYINELVKEQENVYLQAMEKRVRGLIIRANLEEVDEKIKGIELIKVTRLEKIFGKEKLKEAMLQSFKMQKKLIIKKWDKENDKKIMQKDEIFAMLLSYVQEKGLTGEIKTFITTYYNYCATEEEEMIEPYLDMEIRGPKELLEEKIPLLKIQERTKKILEETSEIEKSMDLDKEESDLNIHYDISNNLEYIMKSIKEMREIVEERKQHKSNKDRTADEKIEDDLSNR